ncbi:hypothetical protein G6F40_013740 [Rhizopus arrhizus]|nr:hypothetical protein G6F40_013740 [Rhizopus arrhizus]
MRPDPDPAAARHRWPAAVHGDRRAPAADGVGPGAAVAGGFRQRPHPGGACAACRKPHRRRARVWAERLRELGRVERSACRQLIQAIGKGRVRDYPGVSRMA